MVLRLFEANFFALTLFVIIILISAASIFQRWIKAFSRVVNFTLARGQRKNQRFYAYK